jgi:small-conductance mechanosensitive channel
MHAATDSFTHGFDAFMAFLPNLVAGLVILVVGYLAALLLGRVTRALLRRTSYDRFLARIALLDQDRIEAKRGSEWTGKAVFWVVMLVAVMQAARAWQLEMLGVGIGHVIAYLPHLIGAAVIFAAALYFGTWVRDRIAHREMKREGTDQRPLVASSVRAGILALGAFMALRELQIAPEIVTLAFGVTMASIGLAAALAFGLGSRSVAERLTHQWYDQRPGSNGSRRAAPPSDGAQPTHPSGG